MILPQSLNHVVVGEVKNFFVPADELEVNYIQEEIIITSNQDSIEIKNQQDSIELDAVTSEIVVEDIEENVETVQSC